MQQTRHSKPLLQVLRLAIKNARVCFPVSSVDKILPLMMLEAVPGAPFYMLGLMNFAGKSIPVFDLAVLLGLEREQVYSLDTAILLMHNGGTQLGFVADQILGLANICKHDIQIKNEFKKITAPILGSVPIENQLFLFLNIEKLLNDVSNSHAAEVKGYEHENE